MYIKKNIKTNTGLSLVISLIMMALLLSLSFSISNIILRQIRLTQAVTSSQTAFYAADSGLECALYWDTHSDGTVVQSASGAYFGTTTSYGPSNNPVKCGIGDVMNFQKALSPDDTIATTTFSIDYGNTCALVEVVKTPFRTKISSSGYNIGANAAFDGCDTVNAVQNRVVERGIVFSH